MTADAKSRAYGDANPALTYQVGGSGLVNGDTLSGALATSATTSSDAGVYGITQGTLAASSNYAFAFVGANLTVTPADGPSCTDRRTRSLREVAGGFARAAAARADARGREHRATVSRNRLQIQAMP